MTHTQTHDEAAFDEVGSPTPVPKVSRWFLSVMIFLLAAGITGVFLLGWLPKVQQQQTLAEETERRVNAIPEVLVVTPTIADAQKKANLPGEVLAFEETVIYPRTSGYLKKWHVDIGDSVEAGQRLAEIDTPEVDQQLKQAEATCEQLNARRKVAETKLYLAEFTFNRLKRLIDSQAASQQEFDEAQAEFALTQQEVKVAQADIEAGQAELQRIKELQSFAKVVAPFAGIITERSIDLGQLVTSGNDQAQSLFRLVRSDRVRVVVNVPQVYASRLAVGQSATLKVRGLPRQVFEGTIARTARALDLETRTMRIEVEVENEEGLLIPGAYVQVDLPVELESPPLMVPASALIFNAQGTQIAVVDSQDRVELRPVEVEEDRGTRLGISVGIEASDRVVVNPGERLRDGMSVRCKTAAEEE